MLDDSSVDEITHRFDDWNTQKINVALKTLEGKEFIDLRKWFTSNQGVSRPMKGIMLSVKHWPKVVEMVNEMLARHGNVTKSD